MFVYHQSLKRDKPLPRD